MRKFKLKGVFDKFMNDTSMATPYVSRVAALMLSANPYLTPNEVQQIIVKTTIAI